jgi:hypothetical protein
MNNPRTKEQFLKKIALEWMSDAQTDSPVWRDSPVWKATNTRCVIKAFNKIATHRKYKNPPAHSNQKDPTLNMDMP